MSRWVVRVFSTQKHYSSSAKRKASLTERSKGE
jgi:hypothetical protein